MSEATIVQLNEDGSFTAQARGAACHLVYDSETGYGRWILIYASSGEAAGDVPLSIHADLDDALNALVIQTGHEDTKFSISLPNGSVFSRPGRMPAEQVLAVHGYILVETLVAYVIYEAAVEMDKEDATRSVREVLTGCPVKLGSVDRMDDVEPTWCCDVTIPFEGYIHEDMLQAHVESLLSGSGLEITSVVECIDVGAEVPDAPNVLFFPKAA